MDGVDPPENMIRCMANNYSVLGFWRSWHRSFNLWVIRCDYLASRPHCFAYYLFRYIYIPLGGAHNAFRNSVLVFSFVALWHDLTFRLLAWGWLVSLFLIPELTARYLLPASHVCILLVTALPYSDFSAFFPSFPLLFCDDPDARRSFAPTQYGTKPWYRHVCALGAVLNMLMMMTANLVGFVIGTDGIQSFIQLIFGTSEGT